ncbi:MAG: hypothetical protein ACYCXF_09345 [Thermoleophilia bacterium]
MNKVVGGYLASMNSALTTPLALTKEQTPSTAASKPDHRLSVAAAVLLLSGVAAFGGRMAVGIEGTQYFGLGKSR